MGATGNWFVDMAKAIVNNSGKHAGERRTDSDTDSYLVVRPSGTLRVISATAAQTIGGGQAGDTHLQRIIVNAALSGTCVINGFYDTAGVAQSYTLPVGFVGTIDFGGALNEAGALVITCANAGDDNKVAVLWSPA